MPDKKIIINSLQYSIPLTIATLSGNISDKADKFILGSILGPTAVGTYSVGYRLSKVILMFVVPLRESYFPEFSDLFETGEIPQVERYLKEGVKYFLLISIPALAGLFLTANPISRLITSGGIRDDISLIVAIISLGLIIFGMDQIYGAVLMADGNTRTLSVFRTSGAGLNVVLNFALIPMFGILGAALATLVAYGFGFVGTFYVSKKHISIRFPFYSLLVILIATGVMFVVGSYIVQYNFIATIMICSIVYFILMILFKEIRLEQIYTKIS